MTRPLLVAAVMLLATIAEASGGAQPAQDQLKRLTLEELMNVDVTLTSRRPEPVGTTAAAIAVVTGDDIRRSGVTTIPDAVSLAAGVHTARYNNGSWSITARGFNATAANKLLVMVDGRTVYSPLFAGVFWNAVDYTLEDIQRIEVVRGPGATLWGANAVNGVVNIVTRHARDTTGTFVQVGAGNEDPVLADVRYGSVAGDTAYRVYAKYAVRGSQRFSDGSSANDRRDHGQAGFRLDRGSTGTAVMVKGDLFYSTNRFPDRRDGSFLVGDMQARWTRPLSARSDLQVQAYVNHERREVPLQLTHALTTVDVDAQHTMALMRHNVVWGGGVRINRDSTDGTTVLSFVPENRTYPVVNGFVQDEFAVVPGRAFITAGIKLERNAFSGAAVQPGVRGRVLLTGNQTLWGSVARALRRPTRLESDIVARGSGETLLALGNPDFEPERLIASDVGYRVSPSRFFTADVTVFHHAIDRLRSQEAGSGSLPLPIIVGNTLNGTSTGIETAVTVQPLGAWRAALSYTGQDVTITRDPGSRDVSGGTSEANDPAHQFVFRNSVDLPGGVDLDVRLRHVSALPNPRVPAYTELGFRVAWRTTPRLTLALVGDDMLHARHPEFNPTARGFEEFERSVRVTMAIRTR